MSGGHYDYDQHRIGYIIEQLKEDIDENKDVFSINTINKFKKGLGILEQAQVYAQRIDWLMSGDDGEESFHSRLKEDLDEL